MTANTLSPIKVIWIETGHARPLCDVPWLGTTVVLSDGGVNFCCFSNAVVGNVNKDSFERIWNGAAMQRIRRALAEQRFPPECASPSCPLYRGDDLHYILERMEGPNSARKTGTDDPHGGLRAMLSESALHVECRETLHGAMIQVILDLNYSGDYLAVDLFAAMRFPNGSIRFLPGFEEYASPFETNVEVSEAASPLRLLLLERPVLEFDPLASFEFCAAVFEKDSNPNILSNCYWSSPIVTFTPEPLGAVMRA